MASQSDVARLADVSFMTVSRVVNGHPSVRPETRERVLQAIEQLGYSPNAAARALNRNKAHAIGVYLPAFQHTLSTPYFVQLLFNMEKWLTHYKYDLLLVSSGHTSDKGYVDLFSQRKVDGLIVMAPPIDAGFLDELSRLAVPTVVVHGRTQLENISYVDTDNYAAVTELMRHIAKCGHTRIGFIAGDLQVLNARDRLTAYKDAMASRGFPMDPSLIYLGDWTAQAGYDAFRHFRGLSSPPTAVVCSNDYMAIGLLKAAHEVGIRVPEELAIVGFDDIEMASFVTPMLTTVRQPLARIGREVIDALLTKINNPEASTSRILAPTELVVRDSCVERP